MVITEVSQQSTWIIFLWWLNWAVTLQTITRKESCSLWSYFFRLESVVMYSEWEKHLALEIAPFLHSSPLRPKLFSLRSCSYWNWVHCLRISQAKEREMNVQCHAREEKWEGSSPGIKRTVDLESRIWLQLSLLPLLSCFWTSLSPSIVGMKTRFSPGGCED